MRAETNARDLAPPRLPTKDYSFAVYADHADLLAPGRIGEAKPLVRRFSEGWRVFEVEEAAERHAAEHFGELVRPQEPDLHTLVNEALHATGWTPERRELWMLDFLYAFCVESEEMNRLDEEWRAR